MRKRLAVGLSLVLGANGLNAQQSQFPSPPPGLPTPPAYPAAPTYPPNYPAQPNYPGPQPPGYSPTPYPVQPAGSAPSYPGLPPGYYPGASGMPNPLPPVGSQTPGGYPHGTIPAPTRPASAPQGNYPGLPPGYIPGGPNGAPGLLPALPQAPGTYPPSALPNNLSNNQGNPAATQPGGPAELPLPYAEQKFALRPMDVQARRAIGGWQVWAGQRLLRDLGENEMNARDMVRVFRDLRPTEWVTIGGAKPIVEYGLTNGRPALAGAPTEEKNGSNANGGMGESAPQGGNQPSFNGPIVTGAGAKFIQPIDLRTARIEPIRGVWCVRDDNNILFNFGTDKVSAEQTIAVIRKYGFNRVGVVGTPTQPVMSYLFASLDASPQKLGGGQVFLNAQIDALTRTGIPIPGVGYTGEMVKIDPQKVEARKSGAEWVVAADSEVLGRFGPTEWAAREAARSIRNARFTEFCKLGGTSNVTFFLTDGKAPTRAPFSAQERSFDLNTLKVSQINGRWAVTEGRKHLFDVSGQQEGETVIRVLRAYGFDQIAHLTAGGPKGGIMFFVKGR